MLIDVNFKNKWAGPQYKTLYLGRSAVGSVKADETVKHFSVFLSSFPFGSGSGVIYGAQLCVYREGQILAFFVFFLCYSRGRSA